MKRLTPSCAILLVIPAAYGHDVITTAITFDREIVRIIYDKCASCHRPGGTAFSLLTYTDARPWAVAIKEEILRRRMPPWGAVKGFGEFRNDQGLTSEELELFLSWLDGGTPEGDDKNLPPPLKLAPEAPKAPLKGTITVNGEYKLLRPFVLDGLLPKTLPPQASLQIVAELPDGSAEPLVWIDNYNPAFPHPFLFRKPLSLPAGAVLRGVPAGATLVLLPPGPPAKTVAPAKPANAVKSASAVPRP
jgi:hypothetical protein